MIGFVYGVVHVFNDYLLINYIANGWMTGFDWHDLWINNHSHGNGSYGKHLFATVGAATAATTTTIITILVIYFVLTAELQKLFKPT